MSVETDPHEEAAISVALGHVYREIMRAAQRYYLDVLRADHYPFLNRTGIEMLHDLMHHPEISQRDLQRSLGVEGALITRYAKQMEAAGLIARRVDPQDNRLTLVSLTPEGQRLITEGMRLRASFEAHLMAGLAENEQHGLLRAIQRIQANARRMQQGWGTSGEDGENSENGEDDKKAP